MLRLIRPLWFVPFVIVLALASPAAAQTAKEIKSLADLPSDGIIVGKTVCFVVAEDFRAPGEVFHACVQVRGVSRVGEGVPWDKNRLAVESVDYPLVNDNEEVVGVMESPDSLGRFWYVLLGTKNAGGNRADRGLPIRGMIAVYVQQ